MENRFGRRITTGYPRHHINGWTFDGGTKELDSEGGTV